MISRSQFASFGARAGGNRLRALLLALPIVVAPASRGVAASVPPPRNYVFFDRARERIREREFLDDEACAGAQLKYTWKELETRRDQYDFSAIVADCALLAEHGKRLFVQLQDVSFDDASVPVPDYLREDPAFSGGAARKFDVEGEGAAQHTQFKGWVARRWDPAVRARFAALLEALAGKLDGKLEGVNLAETAVEFGDDPAHYPAGFTPEGYAEAVKATMTSARNAFTRSRVLVYANFMPGEWLPDEDRGYLRAVYAHADVIGAGVGGPDLLPHRKGQRTHSYPLIAARKAGIVAGIAVQSGNLEALDPSSGKRVTPEELFRFARDELHVDYVFWGVDEPFYSRDVLPFLRRLATR